MLLARLDTSLPLQRVPRGPSTSHASRPSLIETTALRNTYIVADESLDIFAAHLQQQLSAASAAEIEYVTQQPLEPNGPIPQHPTRRMLTWERRLVRVCEWYATQARKDLRVLNHGSPYWRNPLSLLAIITGWSSRYRPVWDALAAQGEGRARAAIAQLLLMAEPREEPGR